MAEGGVIARHVEEADDDEANFDTPPESPDDVRLDLSPPLQAELDELQSTEEYIKKNQEWIARSYESVRELEATMDKLMGQTSSRKQELESRTKKIQEMKKEIEEISADAIEKEEEELKRLIDAEKRVEDPAAEAANANRVSELLMRLEAYQERLGIQINTSQGCIEFVFTQIDTHCPENPFSIKLGLEGDVYKCVSCEPPVANVDQLISDLNRHLDLQKFIVNLRSEFKLLVDKEN